MNPEISVIVPIYNVENYLDGTIKSILNQTFVNFELLLIDDGSSDRSSEICKYYSEIDQRIRYFRNLNSGVSSTRNFGIDHAIGNWIMFVDSDDCIEPITLDVLYQQAIEYNADISSCWLTNVCETNRETYLYTTPTSVISKVISIDEVIEGLLYSDGYRYEVWNKLWKRSVIGETRFKTNQLNEEVSFDKKTFLSCSKFVVNDLPLYHYLIERPGNTNSKFREEIISSLEEYYDFGIKLQEIGKERQAQIIYFNGILAGVRLYYLSLIHI